MGFAGEARASCRAKRFPAVAKFVVHGSVSGRDFRSKMQTEHTELLQSPWLIELGAFHLNCDSSDIDEPAGFFKNKFFKNFSCDLTATHSVMTMAISEIMKYDYSLTCPICLDTIFNPYAVTSPAKAVRVALHPCTSSRVSEARLQRPSALYAERLVCLLTPCISMNSTCSSKQGPPDLRKLKCEALKPIV
ncbi:E3 ubiquitin-protein ligase BAH1 [Hordeum vulgare]|nr:E3 ubiquitin-protein ligase BAH1 [Hordeum vulgare]